MARGPGRPAWNHEALSSPWMGRESAPASSGGNERRSSKRSENPADASGAFRPAPRASTEVVTPFF